MISDVSETARASGDQVAYNLAQELSKYDIELPDDPCKRWPEVLGLASTATQVSETQVSEPGLLPNDPSVPMSDRATALVAPLAASLAATAASLAIF